MLPLGSYIDALNQSPKNLAHFLRYLDKNDELYNNYLAVRLACSAHVSLCCSGRMTTTWHGTPGCANSAPV